MTAEATHACFEAKTWGHCRYLSLILPSLPASSWVLTRYLGERKHKRSKWQQWIHICAPTSNNIIPQTCVECRKEKPTEILHSSFVMFCTQLHAKKLLCSCAALKHALPVSSQWPVDFILNGWVIMIQILIQCSFWGWGVCSNCLLHHVLEYRMQTFWPTWNGLVKLSVVDENRCCESWPSRPWLLFA